MNSPPMPERMRLRSGSSISKIPRHLEALNAAATAFGWDTRPSASVRRAGAGGELIGRGAGFATRGDSTIVATLVEVGVQAKTGVVRVRRIACAHDCGFIVNPKSLQGTIEANLVQSISRAIYEEATFDDHTVMSRDWATYPVARMRDVPDEVKIVMINRPSIPPGRRGRTIVAPDRRRDRERDLRRHRRAHPHGAAFSEKRCGRVAHGRRSRLDSFTHSPARAHPRTRVHRRCRRMRRRCGPRVCCDTSPRRRAPRGRSGSTHRPDMRRRRCWR